jgi:glycine/D-amino acid oxidase-like deaminating enzyme
VVVATHLSFLDRGLYFARCHPERSYVVAGPRGGELPAGMYLSTESPAHSMRAHGDWLLVGGESHKTGQADAGERYERLTAWARERFGLEPELRWATQDHMPVDGVPYVGRHDPLSVEPVGGHGLQEVGLAMGTAAGELLAAQIGGREHPSTRLFDPKPAAAARERTRLREGERERGVPLRRRPGGEAGQPALYAPGLPARLERRRGDLGLPLPRLPLLGERRGDRGPAVRPLER